MASDAVGASAELYAVPRFCKTAVCVRVRILKPLSGIIDGIALSQFVPGNVYQVPEDIGAQLIEMSAATEAQSSDPLLATPRTSSADVDVERVSGGIVIVPPDTGTVDTIRDRKKS